MIINNFPIKCPTCNKNLLVTGIDGFFECINHIYIYLIKNEIYYLGYAIDDYFIYCNLESSRNPNTFTKISRSNNHWLDIEIILLTNNFLLPKSLQYKNLVKFKDKLLNLNIYS